MPLSPDTTQALLKALGSWIRWVSLNDGLGVETQADREPITWDISPTQLTSNIDVEFVVPHASELAMLGYWTAQTGGTCLGTRYLDESVMFRETGYYVIRSGSITEKLADREMLNA